MTTEYPIGADLSKSSVRGGGRTPVKKKDGLDGLTLNLKGYVVNALKRKKFQPGCSLSKLDKKMFALITHVVQRVGSRIHPVHQQPVYPDSIYRPGIIRIPLPLQNEIYDATFDGGSEEVWRIDIKSVKIITNKKTIHQPST